MLLVPFNLFLAFLWLEWIILLLRFLLNYLYIIPFTHTFTVLLIVALEFTTCILNLFQLSINEFFYYFLDKISLLISSWEVYGNLICYSGVDIGPHYLCKLTLVWFSPPSGFKRSKSSWSQAISLFLEPDNWVFCLPEALGNHHILTLPMERRKKIFLIFQWKAHRQENKTWFLNGLILPHLLILLGFCGLDLESSHN